MKYVAYDKESGISIELESKTIKAAKKEAIAWIIDGYYDSEHDSTIYGHCRLMCDEETLDDFHVAIDPKEPRCITRDDNHKWDSPIEVVGGIEINPGVFGHGGGTIGTEVCVKCGVERTTDNWAQCSEDGRQGLDSISYNTENSETNLKILNGKET